MPEALIAKADLVREHPEEYRPNRSPELLEVAPARYLAVSGRGAPGGPEFRRKLSALYPVLYTIKMAGKRAGRDFRAMPLEALWRGPRGAADFTEARPQAWRWDLLIRVPEFVGPRQAREAVADLRRRGQGEGASEVELRTIREGRCVQMLHVGPYADEPRSIAAMERFARERHLDFRGDHHEIYLSNPGRTAPARLKTILRHPVR